MRAYLLGTRAPGPKTIATEGEAEEPVVTGVSPSTGKPGTTVTITGTHLGKVNQVLFGAAGPAQFTIVNAKTITAMAPVMPTSATYPIDGFTTDVAVISDGGIPSPSVAADQFTYPNPLPVVTSISPSSGSFGTIIKITGANFTGATEVSGGWNFTVIDDATISAVVPIVSS